MKTTKIKAALLDFDGTLVTEEILDIVCGLVDKKEESKKLNEEFQLGKSKGLGTLIKRINFLQGVSVKDIRRKLEEADYLMPGAQQLFEYFRNNNIVAIIRSGNIEPILEVYKDKLGAQYIIGAQPRMKGDCIDSICEEDFGHPDYKFQRAKEILERLGIKSHETIAVGDSMGDKTTFDFAGVSIAINPKGGVETYADYTVNGDLNGVLEIVKMVNVPKEDLSEKATTKNCPHCNIKSQAFNCPVAETSNFWIVCDAHPLAEGHLLIIPKGHFSCIGAYPRKLLQEFEKIYAYVSDFVSKSYGSVSTSEHGIVGQTVFHSHIHLLPFGGKPTDIIPEGENKIKPIVNVLDLPEIFQDREKYLFFSMGQDKWVVDVDLGAPRFFRDRFAKAVGKPERGNWKEMHFDEGLMKEASKENDRCRVIWKKFVSSHPNPDLS